MNPKTEQLKRTLDLVAEARNRALNTSALLNLAVRETQHFDQELYDLLLPLDTMADNLYAYIETAVDTIEQMKAFELKGTS